MIRIFFGILLFTRVSTAQEFLEPKWCQPQEFMKYEIPAPKTGKTKRLRVFKIDGVTLVGVGVGKSDHVALQKLYDTLNVSGKQDSKYCTWYLNKGNKSAGRVFNHYPMSKPSSKADKAAREWYAKLNGIFQKNPHNISKCIEESKYVAMGCDGQKHRGPSGWGMMLSYLGCSPENAERITRNLWGLNGVKAGSRVAINREGKKIGDEARRKAGKEASERVLASLENQLGPILPNTYNNPFFIPTNFLPASFWPNSEIPTLGEKPTDPLKPASSAGTQPKPAVQEEESDAPINLRPVSFVRTPATIQTGYGDTTPPGYGGSQQQGY